MSNPDLRGYAPATERNREPILAVLKTALPPEGTVLEIASGTGQHAVFFSSHLSARPWLPSDPNASARDSIRAWIAAEQAQAIFAPLAIDVTQRDWQQQVIEWQGNQDPSVPSVTAIVNINMIHISPWAACQGLFAGAEALLAEGSRLYLYGPYKRNGQHTAPSNEAFDQSLRSQNSQWGIRSMEQVIELANHHQLRLMDAVSMPANNFSLIFELAKSGH